MALKLKAVIDMMEEFAPSELMENYDNVGLMVGDKDSEVGGILVALDCTLKVIDEAIQRDCNLIITHHPLLFRKPKNITTDTLQGKKIIKLIQNNINLYSSHTNLDSTPGGVNEIMAKILGFNKYELVESSAIYPEAGFGRIMEFKKKLTFLEIIKMVKEKLNIKELRYCGEEDKLISKIAILNGSGQDFIAQAIKKGAECIITGDTTYHYVSDYNEEGLCIIDAGHFDTEWPAMKEVAEIIQNKFNNQVKVSLSEVCMSPYKYK